jgi:hypothetical protein
MNLYVACVARLAEASCSHLFARVGPLVLKFGVARLQPLQRVGSHDVGALALPAVFGFERLLLNRLRDEQFVLVRLKKGVNRREHLRPHKVPPANLHIVGRGGELRGARDAEPWGSRGPARRATLRVELAVSGEAPEEPSHGPLAHRNELRPPQLRLARGRAVRGR